MRKCWLQLLSLLVILAVLVSCSSLFESAVQSVVESDSDSTKPSGGSEQKGTPAQDAGKHNIVGTWINPEYNSEGRSARLVYSLNEDGTYTYLAFDTADGGGEVYEGTVSYSKIWTDEQGRSCGVCVVTLHGGMSWESLDRISVDGSTLEVQSGVRKINPEAPRYSIYYRP